MKEGVPRGKIVVGAAFYGRMWKNVSDSLNGLDQQATFKLGIPSKNFVTVLSADSGFVSYWDSTAQAPYSYKPAKKLFVTYDDKRSLRLKTKYVFDHALGGIMFWQLREDAYTDGLLDAIGDVKSNYNKHK